MTMFLQCCAAVLLAVVLILALGNNREMGTLLALAVCVMAAAVALSYLSPVLDFLGTLETLGSLDSELVEVLLKVTGISVLTEIVCMVCNDTGNASLGKTVQLLGTAVMMWLSLPLLRALMELLETILGEL